MKEAVTLKKNYEFRRMYHKAKSAVMPALVIYCRRNSLDHNRLGITVGVKLGGAVVRNRVRRRFREIYRLNTPSMKQGFDIVIVARTRAVRSDYSALDSQFVSGLKRLSLLKGDDE